MKKILILLVASIGFLFTSCSNSFSDENLSSDNQSDTFTKFTDYKFDSITMAMEKENEEIERNKEISGSKEIPVGLDNFTKLVSYIERNGFVVPQQGVNCDHQFTFFDSKGNRHAMITIKRDVNGNPSYGGIVSQISVWAYEKGIKDQEHFFGYQITREKVAPFILEIDGTWKHAEDVKIGYEDFLVKVTK